MASQIVTQAQLVGRRRDHLTRTRQHDHPVHVSSGVFLLNLSEQATQVVIGSGACPHYVVAQFELKGKIVRQRRVGIGERLSELRFAVDQRARIVWCRVGAQP
jgi:hypothetical protein